MLKGLISFLLVSMAAVHARPAAQPSNGASAEGPNYWFSFGDSYTQTWFDPDGIPPSSGNPLGNPPYPGWTATGGANWVGFLTTEYNKSEILTWNYAYGGAVTDRNLVTPWKPDVLDLVDEVNQFLNGAAKKPATAPWTSENALFSFFIGINDIGNSFWLPGSRDDFNDVLLDRVFGLIQKIYDVGGRNFLFVTIPAIDRSPLMLAQPESSRALEASVIASYNRKLIEKIDAFKKTDETIKTWVWDANAQYHTILDDPTAYGFKDATSWGSGSDQFWGNDYHPSTYADRLFAEEVARYVLVDTIW